MSFSLDSCKDRYSHFFFIVYLCYIYSLGHIAIIFHINAHYLYVLFYLVLRFVLLTYILIVDLLSSSFHLTSKKDITIFVVICYLPSAYCVADSATTITNNECVHNAAARV